ncbi:MAG TPA: ferritin family protein [Desulfomonilia bacterium]|jgi:rubrerythrin
MSTLTQKQEKLLLLFKKAIKGEQDAQRLYAEMLDSSDDPSIKDIIREFILQEKNHEELLLKKYKILRNTDEFKD